MFQHTLAVTVLQRGDAHVGAHHLGESLLAQAGWWEPYAVPDGTDFTEALLDADARIGDGGKLRIHDGHICIGDGDAAGDVRLRYEVVMATATGVSIVAEQREGTLCETLNIVAAENRIGARTQSMTPTEKILSAACAASGLVLGAMLSGVVGWWQSLFSGGAFMGLLIGLIAGAAGLGDNDVAVGVGGATRDVLQPIIGRGRQSVRNLFQRARHHTRALALIAAVTRIGGTLLYVVAFTILAFLPGFRSSACPYLPLACEQGVGAGLYFALLTGLGVAILTVGIECTHRM